MSPTSVRELLSFIGNPAIVVERDGTITYRNKPAEQLFGNSMLLHRRLGDMLAHGEKKAFLLAVENAQELGAETHGEQSVLLHGCRWDVRALCVDDQIALLLHSAEAKQPDPDAPLEAAAADALLKTIVDSAADLIFVKDMAGRFLLTNQALRDAAPDLLGKTVFEEYETDLAQGYDAADQAVMSTGQSCTIEETIPVRGERRLFQTIKVPWIVSGEMRGVIGISRDITERHRAEALIRESEERYRLAARATNEAIWDWDLVADEVSWNEAIERLAGEKPDRSGLWWKARIDPADRERVLDSIAQFIRGELTTWQCEYGFRHADGTFHAVFDRGFLVRNESGEAVRMIGAMSDLSERMKAQNRVVQLQSELIHVSRVSAMGTIASALAHEINQPLASASNFVAGARRLLVRSDREVIAKAREAIDLAASEVSRAGEIVRRIRRMVAHGETQDQPVPLRALIDDALALALPNSALSGVTVRLGARRGVARGDSVQLQQVLVNLIRNSVEAMETASQRVLTLSTAHGGGHVRIDVQDTGCGIPPDRIGTVFTAFGSSKAGGLGVGLTICRTIVEAHGGRIWVERSDSQGTMIAVQLPAHANPAAK
ncbi:ATP-binding protein [Sphingomonas sp. MA1305]|uniref:ATP-binding protein n=1 Tax=Sphingomonas sp. MA1305 TaxID=2479204 RepID=UPI0018DF3EC2|nr:ATP-binding protein [Sphingomonas sp. MA1305]